MLGLLDTGTIQSEWRTTEEVRVTLVWLVIWFVADRIGDREALLVNPVNLWAGTLLFAVALDLSKTHVLDRRGN